MSLPLNMMYSYTSLRGGICFGACLFSVPNDFTIFSLEKKGIIILQWICSETFLPFDNVTVASLLSTS